MASSMKVGWWMFLGLFVLGLARNTEAVMIDDKETLQFTAKLQTRVSLRLQDADGWTFPDVAVGNLVQWRNLAMLEINHDLSQLTKQLDILYPLRALNIRSKYHLSARFMYDAVYDVGPQAYQDTKEQDKENINSFSHQYDLWEFYVDLSRGPWFFRLGKQNLAWGETDIFRLLDYINPLDNTFGGPFEDLDDRRIPLWMLRGSYNAGRLGPVASITLDGFWVPGSWDARVAPWAPWGTPYAAPLPIAFHPFIRVDTPAKTLSNSRWGVRLSGIVADVNVSLAHYKTFLDGPALTSAVDQSKLLWIGDTSLLTSLDALTLRGSFPDVQITGLSANFWESHLDAVFRTEVAFFWDEPVFIPEENLASLLAVETIPLPPPLLDFAEELFGIYLPDLGLDGLPVNPQSGTIPKKNILRFMIGFDKQIWIRPLNKASTFFVSMQYFGQWIPDYDDRLAQAAPIYPDMIVFPKLYEFESVFTMIVNSSYRQGTITPQLALAYDARGAWLIQPTVSYIWGAFRFMLQYSAIEGNFTGFGLFRDRDQISFALSYLLN